MDTVLTRNLLETGQGYPDITNFELVATYSLRFTMDLFGYGYPPLDPDDSKSNNSGPDGSEPNNSGMGKFITWRPVPGEVPKHIFLHVGCSILFRFEYGKIWN